MYFLALVFNGRLIEKIQNCTPCLGIAFTSLVLLILDLTSHLASTWRNYEPLIALATWQ